MKEDNKEGKRRFIDKNVVSKFGFRLCSLFLIVSFGGGGGIFKVIFFDEKFDGLSRKKSY